MKFLVLTALCFFIYFNGEVKAECGGFIEATSGIVEYPGYPISYPPDQRCTWEIKIPSNKSIWLYFKKFNLSWRTGGICANNYVSLKTKMEDGSFREHGKYCSVEIYQRSFRFNDSNILQIEFKSSQIFGNPDFELYFFTECGGFIEASNRTITSPFHYPPNQRCTWEIKIPQNKSIWLHFSYFHLKEGVNCTYDYLSLKTKRQDGSVREEGKYCSKEISDESFYFKDSSILQIEFKSDQSSKYGGFQLDFFTVSECKEIIEAINGTITSPEYPQNYSPYQIFTWEIRMPPNKSIWLYFKHFHLEQGPHCKNDYVSLKSKMENGSVREHGKYCDRQIHGKSFQFNDSSILQIEFKSNHQHEYKGFELDFLTVPFECGEMLQGSEGIITSPRFPLPYPPDLNCTWNIQAPLNHIIKLTFTDFKTQDSIECDQDHVTVRSKMADGEFLEYGKFCGGKAAPVIVSESNLLQIQFLSLTNNNHTGFKATFISVECGGLIEGSKGNISSPFFPDSYPPNKMCEWTILVPPQHKIKLHFLHFETEEGDGCPNDFLQIQSNSKDGKIHEYGKYCGDLELPSVTSKDSLILKFVSDHSFNSAGFKAEYLIEKLTGFEKSISPMRTTTPVYEPLTLTAEHQHHDITTEFVTSSNEEYTFSDTLKLLTEKVASLEETQKILLSNYEDMLKVSSLMTSKDVFLQDGGKNTSSSIERKLSNDCGKYIFFLRRMLESEL